MRKVTRVTGPPRRRLRSRLFGMLTSVLPVWLFLRMMEYRFINFGVETTNICNANCTFCGYRYMQRPKKVMPWEVYEKAVREFARTGGGTINFTPTVGDPLVDKRLIDKLEFSCKLPGIDGVFLYTNGILLHRFDLDRMLQSGLTRLAISTFIGDREGYKRYYGKDKYGHVVQNIITVAKRNRELGSPVRITLHLRVEGDKRTWYETDVYREVAALIGEDNIDYLDVYDAWGGLIKKDDIPVGTGLDSPLPVEAKKRSPCFEMYRRVHVLANGNVGVCVCVDLEGEIKIGNVEEQSLDDIWRGEALRDYRREWKRGNLPKVCQSCTRYGAVDDFIANNKRRLAIDFFRRVSPGLVNRLTR